MIHGPQPAYLREALDDPLKKYASMRRKALKWATGRTAAEWMGAVQWRPS
jgi:hypothetical protein